MTRLPMTRRALCGAALFFLFAFIAAFAALYGHLISDLLLNIQSWQRQFHDAMANRIHAIAETHSLSAQIGLVVIGFLYGALHAIGPGHGKIVVSSYLLASRSTLKRGLFIALTSAIMQAFVAILLVMGAVTLFHLGLQTAQIAEHWMEIFSYAMIILLGLFLLWRGLSVHPHHAHGCGCCAHHMPSPAALDPIDSWHARWTMIVSIGLRPCSGAVLLLLLAAMANAQVAGIIATFAMALGTALTTSGLAFLSVQSRSIAIALVGESETALRRLQRVLCVAGGVFLILMGALFLTAQAPFSSAVSADTTAHHPLMHPLNNPN